MQTDRGGAGKAPTPLYERLPHGPHRLSAEAVLRNQRTRMHGAMVEAVAMHGYERTSVKQVVGLAGVSRRSFYEQFANKQECFLATYDLIAIRGAGRVGAAYRDARGDTEQRMQAAFGELGKAISDNWNSANLAILEAPKVGAAGLLRLRRASATFEQMLAGCFEHGSAPSPLPAPVIRGIAGGLHAALSNCLREGTADAAPRVTEEMFRWTLLFQTPAAKQLAERLSERAHAALAQGRKAPGDARRRSAAAGRVDDRERLLEQALRLAVVEDYRELSAPQIADAAGVSIDAFFELFDGKQECFLAALDMLGEELMALATDPGLRSEDWPNAVRRTIGEMMRFLAERPIYAQTIAGGVYAAGPEAIERNVRLAQGIAGRLTDGAPRDAHSKLVVQGVAGALSHTVRCQVASGQIQLLSVLADYLSYIVLAPFLGAEQAASLVIEPL
ncbi:MAG TPA: TetR/AcrR family transcriptional regulator [Solirubrobacteraceae bacterium]|jgi:AcrR family transcriptional regulator|nr:TetR/AcrR family transcriptional regulator [Solirubrobacteraceae bacterium]